MSKVALFDFDYTLIDTNSDFFVFEEVAKDYVNILHKFAEEGLQWNACMDKTMERLFEDGHNAEDVLNVLKRIPISKPDFTRKTLEYLKSKGFQLIVVSDANTVYIKTVLESYNLLSLFSDVISNPCTFDYDAKRLKIEPYMQSTCPHCPANMCKGHIVKQLRLEEKYETVVYFGDGWNDFCPARILTGGDYVCPRRGFELEKKVDEAVNSHSWNSCPTENILKWTDWEELFEQISKRF